MAHVVDIMEPFIVQPGTAPTKLFAGRGNVYAYSCFVAVRDMGDATYVGIGSINSQTDRLLGIGDWRQFEIPGMLVNVGKLFAISDFAASKPTLEVSGLFDSAASLTGTGGGT